MQGHQLHLIGAFLLVFLTLQHIAQHQFGNGAFDVCVFVFIQAFFQRVDQHKHIAHALLGHGGRRAVLHKPVQIVDIAQQLADGLNRVLFVAASTQHIQPLGKFAQTLHTGSWQVGFEAQFCAGAVHGYAALGGVATERLQGAGADFSARHVHNAQEGIVVIRVDQ